MKSKFLSNFCRQTGNIDISLSQLLAGGSLAVAGVAALSLWAGFHLGERHAAGNRVESASTEVHQMLAAERQVIADAKAQQRAHLDALALKIAELQAHLVRLDALGDRLVEVGKLDKGEFDFSSAPPLGGIDDSLGESLDVAEIGTEMGRLSALLEDREEKLAALEQVLMNRELLAEIRPSGRPVKKGWMSSAFGKRTDPFKGKKSYHRGLDFAGKPGSDVVAVASGVVVRARKDAGYGNFVEIKHAAGYSTLYAHNEKNLVKVGDVVSKGQTIALLGSTGRSSGPHVHFEVHRNGKIVNPLKFVRNR